MNHSGLVQEIYLGRPSKIISRLGCRRPLLRALFGNNVRNFVYVRPRGAKTRH